jgi:hypothetical protein
MKISHSPPLRPHLLLLLLLLSLLLPPPAVPVHLL